MSSAPAASQVESDALESAIFSGIVRHRRFSPTQHEFEYSIHMFMLRADELPQLMGRHWQLGTEWYRWARFKRADYLGGAEDLGSSVKAKIAELAGPAAKDIEGDVFCLVHLRYLGFYFSPLNVYFLKQQDRFRYMLAEVSNTPWHEKHYYLVDLANIESHAKEFHVSPFNPMQQNYHWIIKPPDASHCSVHIGVHDQNEPDEKVFDATLSLKRREINQSNLSRVLSKTPSQTLYLVLGIYWEALRLLCKRTPLYRHPKKQGVRTEKGTA